MSDLALMAEAKGDTDERTETETLTAVPSCSNLTTKELQEMWREEKRKDRSVKLLFKIPSTRIITNTLSKFVVYRVVVLRSGSFDSHPVWVERRYSEFRHLHQGLLEDFGEVLEDVLLPRRLLTGNFSPGSISERRLALQDYLAQLFSVRVVRSSARFCQFLLEVEQRRALGLLRAGHFTEAVEVLQEVLELQEKLLPWNSPILTVPTLSALAICHRDLDQLDRAFSAASRALPPARRYGLRVYRGALLELMVDMGYQLRRPVAQMQEELTTLRDSERGEVCSQSLKEVVIQEFL